MRLFRAGDVDVETNVAALISCAVLGLLVAFTEAEGSFYALVTVFVALGVRASIQVSAARRLGYRTSTVVIWPFSFQPRHDRVMEYAHRVQIGSRGVLAQVGVAAVSLVMLSIIQHFLEDPPLWTHRVVTMQIQMLLFNVLIPLSFFDGALVWTSLLQMNSASNSPATETAYVLLTASCFALIITLVSLLTALLPSMWWLVWVHLLAETANLAIKTYRKKPLVHLFFEDPYEFPDRLTRETELLLGSDDTSGLLDGEDALMRLEQDELRAGQSSVERDRIGEQSSLSKDHPTIKASITSPGERVKLAND